MTIVHIVLVKPKATTSQAQLASMCAAIVNLKSHIPSISRVSAGPNFTQRAKGYTHGAVVEIDGNNEESLNMYLNHVEHVRVKNEEIVPIVDDVLAFDYTV